MVKNRADGELEKFDSLYRVRTVSSGTYIDEVAPVSVAGPTTGSSSTFTKGSLDTFGVVIIQQSPTTTQANVSIRFSNDNTNWEEDTATLQTINSINPVRTWSLSPMPFKYFQVYFDNVTNPADNFTIQVMGSKL